jgi:hypothetical protein
VKTVILSCNTLRGELEKAAGESGCPYPFIWVESGLHLVPGSLRSRLQEELDRVRGVHRILLGFGYCGHAVIGLQTKGFQLVIPRVDDCITWLLGSRENRKRCVQEGGVYFLTQGWLEGEMNIWKEYQSVLDRFGPERTERVYRRMLAHYRFLGLIDTGAYDVEALFPQVREIASILKLQAKIVPGSDQYLKKFLTGPWDPCDFLIIPPHTCIDLHHLGFGEDPCLSSKNFNLPID